MNKVIDELMKNEETHTAQAVAQRAAAAQPDAAETEEAVGGFGPDFKPLTADEASQWRARQPAMSPWHVLGCQAGAGVLIALVAWSYGGSAGGWSAAWGVLSVIVPAALFARALARRPLLAGSGSALLRLMVWEAVKVVVTLAMLLASPRVVAQLSWPILVASFVVTMKMYWAGWWLLARRRPPPV